MFVLRKLVFMLLMFANSSHSLELIFYTGNDNSLNDEAFLRLQTALNKLGHQAIHQIVATRRTLQLANTIGDGDLMRIAELKTLYPELTNNLVKVEFPLMTVEFVEVSKQNIAEGMLNSGKVAILKDVFILEERYPNAVIIDGHEKLFELLDADRVEKIILPVSSQRVFVTSKIYSPTYNVKTLSTQKLYTYLHKKHESIATQLATILASMEAQQD
jgi:hypothetical protein